MSESKVKIKVTHNVVHLPAIALRGLVVFPNNIIHFEVGRAKSIAAIEAAMRGNSSVFLVAQKETDVEEPAAGDLYAYGVIAEIKQVLRVSEDLVKVLVEGKTRAKLLSLDGSGKFLMAEVRTAPVRGIAPSKRNQTEALVRSLKDCFEEYLSYSPQISKDIVYNIVSSDSPLYLSEYMPANLLFKFEDKQAVLNESTLLGRLEKLLILLHQECDILSIEKDIDDKVNIQMDKSQRDYYLREQMHIISEELGDSEDTRAEAETYREKIKALKLEAESEEKLLKECDRLARMQGQGNAAEISVIRGYLDTCLALPWHTATKDDLDQAHARRVLDKDHYGLRKVKDRILELLAVRKLNTDVKGQIICLVGPPGVGKTSIARSIAECMDRQFARMSLGGVHDEAEIRGHRRTYIGAMPGRIINAMLTAKTSNPVLLLDEIDKLAGDYRGDPASALLEVLDPEQNRTFKDNFLDIPFDLSEVLFITTANDASTIPAPLLDRMDMIELPSYTRVEKFNIAKRHLVPKQLKNNGLTGKVTLTAGALYEIIDGYTREAGRAQPGAHHHGRAAQMRAEDRRRGRREHQRDRADGQEPAGAGEGQADLYLPLGRRGHRQRPGLDQRGRRDAARGGQRRAGRFGQDRADRLAGRCDEGERPAGRNLCARACAAVRHRGRCVQEFRRPHPCARGRRAQGRAFGRRDADDGADLGAVRFAGAPQPGHDRRDHAARQCAADRRAEGKEHGRLPRGHLDRADPQRQHARPV